MVGFSGLWTAEAQRGGRVASAIATASRRTGVDFAYLMGQAQIESSMNPEARARTSSATGLYQFLDQSWLKVVADHGAKHGLGWAADAIQHGSGGRYQVADPQMRQAILDLRKHPETASVMAAEFASDNRAYIEERTGRTAEPVDLYLAHFLGAGGAARFLSIASANPEASGAAIFPAAARANRSIFYDRQGNARSLAAIRENFAEKLDEGARDAGTEIQYAGGYGGSYASPSAPAQVQPADYVRIEQARLAQNQSWQDAADDANPMPQTEAARLAYLMLATLGR
ncbi:MAG: lytic transglycosylase domain-containing protein [Sphingobium sp.]